LFRAYLIYLAVSITILCCYFW